MMQEMKVIDGFELFEQIGLSYWTFKSRLFREWKRVVVHSFELFSISLSVNYVTLNKINNYNYYNYYNATTKLKDKPSYTLVRPIISIQQPIQP